MQVNRQRKKDRANAERMVKKAMDKLITRKEAASILGISVKTLDTARTDGLPPYVFVMLGQKAAHLYYESDSCFG